MNNKDQRYKDVIQNWIENIYELAYWGIIKDEVKKKCYQEQWWNLSVR